MFERAVHGGFAYSMLLAAQGQEQFLGFKGAVKALDNLQNHTPLLRVLEPVIVEKCLKNFLR